MGTRCDLDGPTALLSDRLTGLPVPATAPVHHGRFTVRGGSQLRLDLGILADTSSYGRQEADAVAHVLGIGVLVVGSDPPCATPVDPEPGAAAGRAVRVTNPCHLPEGVRP